MYPTDIHEFGLAIITECGVKQHSYNIINGDCEPKLFSEDFSIMSETKPGCFVFMGNGISGSNAQPLHASNYDFNDEALVIGSSYWSTLVEQQLN